MIDRDRLRESLIHGQRTWRWRLDTDDPDHYLAVESTDAGFHYFAWSHLHGEDGVTREAFQTFDELERDGPLWPLPEAIERQIREWLATQRA